MRIKIFRQYILSATKILFWFAIGAIFGLFLFVSFAFIIFQKINTNVVYPGVIIGGMDLGRKTPSQINEMFAKKNENIGKTDFVFVSDIGVATVSAAQIGYGFDQELITKQAMSIGRSKNVFSDISLIVTAYLNGIYLQEAHHYSEAKLLTALKPIVEKLHVDPIDAIFAYKNGKVTTFKQSLDGQEADLEAIKNKLESNFAKVMLLDKPQAIVINIPIKVLKPNITTEKVNNLGIKELIGEGVSFFQHSIPSRIYNVTLAAIRLNGVLIAPDAVFSFNKALGDISAFTGYKQAYIIQNGKTVLGDGGGVCQVSTTLFRAILNAGLPIIERHAHAYRVSYYEQNSPPGFDATIYSPSVDLRFKNDTGKYILVQTSIDLDTQKLTFSLFGTSDGREVVISEPVVANLTPPLPDTYQDDSSLPKGAIKQVDFAAEGAKVTFTRQVTKDGNTILSDKFVSNFQPWRAVYLRGTKE
ncbi:MAG: VanW family protein [Patescibacteria group bacterium]